MHRWRRTLGVCIGMLAAAPGWATVRYTLMGATGSFTYEADDFVEASRRVAAGELAACSARPGTCTYLDMLPGAPTGQDEFDLAAIYYQGQPYSYSAVSRYYVTSGAFGREGSFAAGNGSVLTVASVPEPTTWSAMLAGFGTIGLAMRRRRKTMRYGAPGRPGHQE